MLYHLYKLHFPPLCISGLCLTFKTTVIFHYIINRFILSNGDTMCLLWGSYGNLKWFLHEFQVSVSWHKTFLGLSISSDRSDNPNSHRPHYPFPNVDMNFTLFLSVSYIKITRKLCKREWNKLVERRYLHYDRLLTRPRLLNDNMMFLYKISVMLY